MKKMEIDKQYGKMKKKKKRKPRYEKEDFFSDYCQRFVKPISIDDALEEGTSSSSYDRPSESLTGQEARSFYDGIISSVPSKPDKQKPKASSVSRTRKRTLDCLDLNDGGTVKRFTERLFALCSNAGNLKELKKHLSSARHHDGYVGALNSTDQFGWTAIMCAATSGDLDAVKTLIKEGAVFMNVYDEAGRDLFDICVRSGNTDIKKYLEGLCFPSRGALRKIKATGEEADELIMCDECGINYKRSKRKQHETSTLHLFKDSSKTAPKNIYAIPENNIGFQMMLRSGWCEDSGLGPVGEGRKNPIKTTLKQDRAGLGLKDQKQRVSHFNAFDSKAVETRTRNDRCNARIKLRTEKSLKRKIADEKHKERDWERDLRRYMSYE